MNILFLLKSLDMGGVEVVTSVLANKFVKEGHHVVIWAFYKSDLSLADRLNSEVLVLYGNGFNTLLNNTESFAKTLRENNIDVVINQWALPLQTTSLLKKTIKKYPVRIISEHHSDPMTNGRMMSIDSELRTSFNPIKRCILRIKWLIIKEITSYSMRRCYNMSDKFVVLADSYKKHLLDFAKVKDDGKLVTIVNPVTIDASIDLFCPKEKQKKLLYVGRLECQNKKPERVLSIWKRISNKAPDWQLDIVGDGPDKEKLKQMANEMKLERYHFWGYQNPVSYYRHASMILLTSDFEGFPLVLTEAMSFGVVPVVYGSFSAVYDIIDDNKNGVIIPKTSGGFNAEVAASRVESLIFDCETLTGMALATVEKSKEYSLDRIYQQWMNVIDNLHNND